MLTDRPLLRLSRPSPDGQRRRQVVGAAFVSLALATPAAAQEPGWHYSPYPGEGDRAAMGCSGDATADKHACLIVRCEDDFSVGLYVKTSRSGGDAGEWIVQIDDAAPMLTATPVPGSPYGGRFTEDVASVIEALRQGSVAYLDPVAGEPPSSNGIPLSGSLYAINQALFFCAPRTGPPVDSTDDGAEESADAGGDG